MSGEYLKTRKKESPSEVNLEKLSNVCPDF